jgi:sec-independent protein translocase protein TatB
MLDFSFGELMMIGAVALVVLGPQRLPRVARAFGEMLGKAQRYVSQVRADFQREIELADLKRLQEEAQKASASIDASFRQVAASLNETAQQASGAASVVSAPPPSESTWAAEGWASHRFRTRHRASVSLDDLAQAVDQLRGRMAMPEAGRFARNRYAPRARVNRPRIRR